MICIKKTAQFW